MATIYQVIRKDHETHRELLDKIAETHGESPERKRLWELFYYDVKSHAAAEEETFYARLMESSEGQDDARHSVSEHKELDDIMEELQEAEYSSPGWLTRFKTLKHDYEHHMDEEEDEIFAKARKVIDEKTAERHADRFLTRKKQERGLVDDKAEEKLEE